MIATLDEIKPRHYIQLKIQLNNHSRVSILPFFFYSFQSLICVEGKRCKRTL